MGNFIYPDTILTTLGHVDHGKTTLVQALSGVWVARHSEEIKRAMTIKLGYVTIGIYECPSGEFRYVTDGLLKDGKCPDGSEPKLIRKISILDVPGHEVLLSTMIAGVGFVDGALMIVDASMPCPQPQTEEHFLAATIMGLREMIVIQNKIDLVPKEKAIENYRQIRKFLAGTWAEKAPVVPVSALHKVNIDAVATLIHEKFPRKERSEAGPPMMHVLRSFNVNKPGTPPEKLVGGVLGGVVVRGELKIGDEIEIRPGLKLGAKLVPLRTWITSVSIGPEFVDYARPGALVGIGTKLDPALTKADSLVGSVVGLPGQLPPVWTEVELEYELIRQEKQYQLKRGDVLMVNVGAATVLGIVKDLRKERVTVTLRKAICAEQGAKMVITKQVENRWRIVGYGVLKGGKIAYE
ncbi:MAG: translation initiation factor IF-2 subunit gamma [Crenarchaeota archaeon]|nr:translation initiation factor IF-2 subunit gamma [Thermoproteota archaeon]